MKTIKILLVAILFVVGNIQPIQAQSNDLVDILDKLEERAGVTSILITKKMFDLFTKTTDIELEGESINEVISKLEKLMIYEIELPSNEQKAISDKISNILKKESYEILMKINEDDSEVEIYILEENDIVKHLFLIAQDKSSMQVISLLGNIDLEQISKLSGTLNIEELEHINKK